MRPEIRIDPISDRLDRRRDLGRALPLIAAVLVIGQMSALLVVLARAAALAGPSLAGVGYIALMLPTAVGGVAVLLWAAIGAREVGRNVRLRVRRRDVRPPIWPALVIVILALGGITTAAMYLAAP